MDTYEDTLKDIEKSFGFVPGFMKGFAAGCPCPRLALNEKVHAWRKQNTTKVQRTHGVSGGSQHKMSVLPALPQKCIPNVWSHTRRIRGDSVPGKLYFKMERHDSCPTLLLRDLR